MPRVQPLAYRVKDRAGGHARVTVGESRDSDRNVGLGVCCYFDNDFRGYAVENTQELTELLGGISCIACPPDYAILFSSIRAGG